MMRLHTPRIAVAGLVWLLLLVAPAWGQAAGFFLDESIPVGLEENLDQHFDVGLGVDHHLVYQWRDPLFLNWIDVDLADAGVRWRALKARDRVEGNERLSAMAARAGEDGWQVIAAINGDFWARGGRPVGLCVVDGRLLTLGDGRPAVVQTVDGRFHIDRFHFDLALAAGGEEIEIDAVNLPANRFGADVDRAVVYTSESINESLESLGAWPPARLESETEWAAVGLAFGLGDADGARLGVNVTLEGELVAVDEASITALWPEDLVVVIGHGEMADDVAALSVGDSATLSVACEEFDEPVAWALGGGPILLREGEVVVTEDGEPGFSAGFITTRHPRSLLGVDREQGRLIALVVDGRQPGLSRGIGLVDAAAWMRDHGMWTAMNFDGGGSSSLWVRGETVSSPSDAGGERSVTDGLFMLSDVAWEEPPQTTHDIDAGETLALVERWSLFPETLDVVVDEEVVLHPRARGDDGQRLRIPRDAVSLTVTPPELATITRDGRDRIVLRGASEGDGSVQIHSLLDSDASASLLAEFALGVGHWEEVLVDGLETTASLPSLELIRFSESETHLGWETETVHEGERALAVDYAMEHGGTSAAYVSLDVGLPEEAQRVGLWVHGDGNAAWLRGVVTDRDGERFLVDFTGGTRGIDWTGWRRVSADLTGLRAHWDDPDARPDGPLTLATVYLAQTRESSKTSGRVVFDEVSVEVFRSGGG